MRGNLRVILWLRDFFIYLCAVFTNTLLKMFVKLVFELTIDRIPDHNIFMLALCLAE